MSTLTLRIIGTGVLFIFVFLSGVWLSNSGKPLSVVISTIHKLIGLAALIFIGATIYQLNQAAPLTALELGAAVITGLLFVVTMITGGLLSTGQPVAAAILTVHRIGPALTVLSTAATLYLLANRPQ
jgi:hypothetical protein